MNNWLIGKDPDAGKRMKAREGDDRGWDSWMASPTQQRWVWVSSGSWWRRGKPGVLQSMGSQRVRHDWATELKWKQTGLLWWLRWWRISLQHKSLRFDPWVRKMPWRKEWLPTPVFLPGEFHKQTSLEGYSPWGCKEVDMTEKPALLLSH